MKEKNNAHPWANIYVALALRLGLVFGVYALCRLAFYYYNRDLLGIDTLEAMGRIMLGGLRFDASAIAYTNILVIAMHIVPQPWLYHRAWQRAIGWVYWLSNVPMLVLNMGDVVYYRFSGRRTSLAVFEEFGNENPLNFVHFLWSYWGITLTTLTIVVLWAWCYRRIRVGQSRWLRSPLVHYPVALLCSAGCIALMIGAMRGGFLAATRPISPANASAYVDRVEQRAMVLNTPFTMIRLADKYVLPEYQFMSEAEARERFNPIHDGTRTTPYTGMMRGRNVVLIIWESMAREWVGALNRDIDGYEGYTPFVDSLMQHAYYFEHAYAGGGKSIDAMPCLMASVPRPQSPFVLSPYSGNRISSVVACARASGYSTAFFHNAPNGSMGFDAMARQLGFERYYGKNEFANDREYDGKWGIWDEPFLQFVCERVSELREPFFAAEFTTTSHEPFAIPERYEGTFAHGEIPIQRTIRYTDYALRRFFERASTMPWYSNTIFVITADHAVPGVLLEYKNARGAFRIPMIIFDPKGALTGRDSSTIVQQADLMPTLLDLLGLSCPVVAFGQNMLDAEADHWAVSTLDGAYQLVRGDYLLQFDGERVLALYDYRQDPALARDIRAERPEVLCEMLPLMQAYLQQFSQRMRHDQLVP